MFEIENFQVKIELAINGFILFELYAIQYNFPNMY